MNIRKSATIMAACAIIILSWLIWGVVRSSNLSKNFERVGIGESRQRVVRLLGRPRRMERCGESFGTPGGKPGCDQDFIYSSPFAPVIPDYWSISFNRSGQVIDKYHYVSP